MADIKHTLVIKTAPAKVYEAITTQAGLSGWWAKQTTAKPEVGFINVFTFGTIRNEFKVTGLDANKRAEWKCINSIDEWIGTTVTFELEEKDGNTTLRFTHGGWKEITDLYARCNYDWARFLRSLKLLCENGAGEPA
jgi:uncharacterized protein YndB with AHSA1/START domain